MLPGEPTGGLLAGIGTGLEKPTSHEVLFVGRQNDTVASDDGELWFSVNDVQNPDARNPDLFYIDNIGTFWVKISVSKR